MDFAALLNAYLNTVLRQNSAAIPTFKQPTTSATLVDNLPSAVPMPQVKPSIMIMPSRKRLSFSIDSILSAPSPPSSIPTPSSSPLPMPSAQPSSPPPTIKTRVAFTPAITKILRDWFDAHLDSPYLDEDATLMLMKQTHLSKTQLMNWFTNRRRSYEQQHGHVKWVKKAAPACAGMKRSAAQRDPAEPAKKMARVSTD